MLNSKLEKFLLFCVWYILLIIFRFVLPISEPPSNIDKYVVLVLSVTVTIIICRIYTFQRNKRILKKINLLLQENQLEQAVKYISNCLNKHKKSYSIYTYTLYTVAMCGRIIEFEKMLSECRVLDKYKKIVALDFVVGLKEIISYFKTYNCITTSVRQEYWIEILTALSENNYPPNIPVLLSMYNTNFGIIKAALALKLYLVYLEMNNIEKSEHYYNEALKCAPSPEVIYYIENARNATQQKDSSPVDEDY